jgi:hypothetical protein
MSRELKAREGAQKVVGDAPVADAALVFPRGSTQAAMLGAAAGSLLGGRGGVGAAWGAGGSLIGERFFADSQDTTPTIVLAITADTLYVLGRDSTAMVGRWDNLRLLSHIPRADVQVKHRMVGPIHQIDLVDGRNGTTLEFESRLIGNLGVKGFLETLTASTQ